MEIIITIFKQQLQDIPGLKTELTHLSQQVRDISAAFLFLPKEENVATFIELLHIHRISFGVHISGEEIPDIIRGGQSNTSG